MPLTTPLGTVHFNVCTGVLAERRVDVWVCAGHGLSPRRPGPPRALLVLLLHLAHLPLLRHHAVQQQRLAGVRRPWGRGHPRYTEAVATGVGDGAETEYLFAHGRHRLVQHAAGQSAYVLFKVTWERWRGWRTHSSLLSMRSPFKACLLVPSLTLAAHLSPQVPNASWTNFLIAGLGFDAWSLGLRMVAGRHTHTKALSCVCTRKTRFPSSHRFQTRHRSSMVLSLPYRLVP